MKEITAKERATLAAEFELSEQLLYQYMTGRRRMDAADARALEDRSGGRLMRWHLRSDWAEIWPELRSHPDAPAVTAPHQAEGVANA